MARRTKHDAQVDPFTAGEPTLPWDEPGAFDGLFDGIEPETCAFDEGPYDGPTKTRDDYNAPSADSPSGTSRRKRPSNPSEARERKRQAHAERAAARRAASAAPQDKQGPSRFGKGLRLFFILVIVANVMPALLYGIVSFFSGDTDVSAEPEPAPTEAPSYNTHDSTPGIDLDGLDEDELTCVQICDAYLQAIPNEQSPERTAIIEDLDQSMVETTGYTCEELGVDAGAYADWALSNFSYRIDSCYARPDEGTASLYFYTWEPDLRGLRSTLRQNVPAYINELNAGKSGDMRPLTEDEQEHVRGLFSEAIENADMDSDSFLGFQLTFEDDTWVLDLEQAHYQLSIPLGY